MLPCDQQAGSACCDTPTARRLGIAYARQELHLTLTCCTAAWICIVKTFRHVRRHAYFTDGLIHVVRGQRNSVHLLTGNSLLHFSHNPGNMCQPG